MGKIEIDDERIYELREKGKGHVEIAKILTEEGTPVSHTTIARRCKAIYAEKGKKEPKTLRKPQNKTKNRQEISDEEIYALRKKGLTQEEIAEHFREQGIEVSYVTIGRRCKVIFEQKGEEEPVIIRTTKRTKNREKISDEEIYQLRRKGLSNKAIANHFTENGIPVGTSTIGTRSKKIYEEKDEEEPKLLDQQENRIKITDEEIYQLREQKLSYRAIAKYFNDRGINVSYSTIRNRCKEIYREQNGQAPEETVNELEDVLKEMISKKEESEELLKKYEDLQDTIESKKGEEK